MIIFVVLCRIAYAGWSVDREEGAAPRRSMSLSSWLSRVCVRSVVVVVATRVWVCIGSKILTDRFSSTRGARSWVDVVARTIEPCFWLWSCESVDLACFTLDCDAPQLYTDAVPVLYASRRV